jgi:5-methylcytosine-specific restriction endonuclease McrA
MRGDSPALGYIEMASKGRIDKIKSWHGDACHICGVEMKFHKKRRSPLKASVDHLLPKSRGGTNAQLNLLLAHQMCNHVRGNAPITDQLRDACLMAIKGLKQGQNVRKIIRAALATA